jgi:hypothetical protein
MHRLLNGKGLEIGQGLLAQAAVAGTGLHHHCRPELVWFRRLVILGWVVWLLSPVHGDDLPGLVFHAGLQRQMGSGVAQLFVKAWAS